MHIAGRKLREVRERLNVTYREVDAATSAIATAKLNPEFYVPLSRLFGIENSKAVPSIYRLYSLAVVYGVSYGEILRWYGVDLAAHAHDIHLHSPDGTRLLDGPADADGAINLPSRLDPGINLKETSDLTRMIQAWGTVPLTMLKHLDLANFRYGRIGFNDWMMHPLIRPGALIQIDTACRKVEDNGWRSEFERPVYFLETRNAYVCSWVTPLEDGFLLQPHTLSPCKALVRAIPQEAEILGRVTGVAMQLSARPEGKAHRA